MSKSQIKAVLLDIDGTLVFSNDEHAQSWVEAFATEGIEVPYEKIRPLIGMGGDRLLPAVSGIEESSEKGQRISEVRKEIFRDKYLPRLKPTPGAREFVQHLQNEGIAVSIATSSGESLMHELLQQAGVDDLIEETVNKDDAESSKPAPDIVRAALKRLGCAPHEAVMIGDTPYDIISAERAGVRAIAFYCGGSKEHDLADAVARYRDPSDLLAQWSTSPFIGGHELQAQL